LPGNGFAQEPVAWTGEVGPIRGLLEPVLHLRHFYLATLRSSVMNSRRSFFALLFGLAAGAACPWSGAFRSAATARSVGGVTPSRPSTVLQRPRCTIYTCTYDASGRLTLIRHVTDVDNFQSMTFVYDQKDQLPKVSDRQSQCGVSYTYDAPTKRAELHHVGA
jgi:hypothetical protein